MLSKEFAVEANSIYKSFAKKEVIHNCSLSVKRGTIYGFLGVNGAGKTTMLKILIGLLRPTSGEVKILGEDIETHRIEVLGKIGSLIEVPTFYEQLSAKKNLEIHLKYMGKSTDNIEQVLEMTGLGSTGKQAVSEFSLGMRQRLAIARSIVHEPELLILDEPLNGLDPMGIIQMRQLFKELVEHDKMTILFSSHILSEVEHVADSIGIISGGNIVSEIQLEEMKQDESFILEDYFISTVKGAEKYDI